MKRDWVIFLISLLLSCFLWALHVLSLDYMAFLQYRVTVTTDMVGYSPSAVADELLLVRGKAAGYYILKAKGFRSGPMNLQIEVDKSAMTHNNDDSFTLPVQSIREQVMEALGEHIVIDFFDTESLTLKYVRQNYRHVPVTVVSNLDFCPQYMRVGDIQIKPDSVFLYGPADELAQITEIMTEPISHENLNAPVNGYVGLDVPDGISINREQVRYSISVGRYVEMEATMKVAVTDVPVQKSLLTLPSEVRMVCRVPFGTRQNAFLNSLSVYVDYDDVIDSKAAKLIPMLANGSNVPIYQYEIFPPVVEGIIVEED